MPVKAVCFVVAGVATIALSHSAAIAYQTKPRSVWDGVYSEEQAKRAEPLYADKCASCHAAQLTGSDAPALVGAEFNANWTDLTLNDLSQRIRLTMPADSPGSLSSPQVADIIALMLKRGAMPSGTADLVPDAMREIKYLASKPDPAKP
jgi:mono/diheme cytochrome c family protein